MTWALLWKELRATLLLAFMLCTAVLLIAFMAWIYPGGTVMGDYFLSIVRTFLILFFPAGAGLLLGADAFAVERARSTDHYLDALPVGRWRIALTKLVVSTIWVSIPVVLALLSLWKVGPQLFEHFSAGDATKVAGLHMTFLSVAFFASLFCRTSLRAMVLAAVMLVFFGVVIGILALGVFLRNTLHGLLPFALTPTVNLIYASEVLAIVLFLTVPVIANQKNRSTNRWVAALSCFSLGLILICLPVFHMIAHWGWRALLQEAISPTRGYFLRLIYCLAPKWSLLILLSAALIYVRK
jgi:ABC-type transport system involved in multi-copper enzyme maturation permease subunit